MHSLNNDMDDLFKKSAENYPLKTDSANWEEVSQKLHTTKDDHAGKHKNNRRFLWLFILLPLLFISSWLIYNNRQNIINNTSSESEINKTNNTLPLDEPSEKAAINSSDNPSEKAGINPSTQTIEEILIKKNKILNFESNDNRLVTGYNVTSPGRIKSKQQKYNVNNNRFELPVVTNETNNKKVAIDEIVSISTEKEEKKNHLDKLGNNDVSLMEPSSNNPLIKAENSGEKISNPAPSEKAIPEKKEAAKNRKLYIGITGGPDVSVVKSTKTSDIGYSLGLFAGYKFSKRIAIEAGILWDKKNYYSEGEYFKTERISVPPHVEILNATGMCNMFEIPVNLKYDFKTNENRSWFFAGGVSSYLMKKEDYTYSYKHYSSTYDVYKEYNNSTNNWFAVANFSVGYQQRFLGKNHLRIEPYAKLPLAGIGIGKLPISSTGVLFSITRDLR